MATVISLLAAAALVPPAAPVVRHGPLQIAVSGGAVVERTAGMVTIRANSPAVRATVANASQGFYNGKLRWLNVPAGSYLVSGRGVAEAASSNGGSLNAPLSLAGGGRISWRLESNFPADYRFAVASTVKSGLRHLPKSPGHKPHFAILLGGSGSLPTMELAESLDFPTYLLPGINDSPAIVRRHLGEAYAAFGVGPDRFLLLDNRKYSLGNDQLEWAGKRLQDFRLDGARRVFVFMHRPPVDPRRHVPNGLANRAEARRLARLLKTVPTVAIFAGHINRSYTRSWYGFKTYMLTDRDVMVVESGSGGLSVRLAVH